ncbi:MAG: UDP-N-acetylmuramoyl-tripeptide--D-alanyl-D-alanine ligase [Terriglobales bacterium]
MRLPLGRIAEITGGIADAIHRDAFATGYSIDSRTLQPGDLFFAIRGEHFDGHDYVNAALDRGAVAAVVQVSQAARFGDQRRIIAVDDTLAALQTLGRAVRRMWNKTVIAITGSAGKTTTKESAARLLSAKFRVLKSEGNLNNHYGLPLQLLRLEPEHQLAVVELGMNHAGEIRALAALCEPNVGVVTCVAPVHLGFFNSVADIARAKYELIQSLPAAGTAVLNADDEYVSQFGRDFSGRVITFGVNRPADVRAEAIREMGPDGSEFDVVAGAVRAHARLPLIGRHNVYNALGAIAVALFGGLNLEEATSGVALLTPSDKRGQVLTVGGATVINDTYNSNPRALDYVVDALAGMAVRDGSRRIVVAGEMLELGAATDDLHRRSGAHMADKKIDVVVGVRGAARKIVDAAAEAGVRAEFVDSPEQAGEWLAREVRPGDIVLLKASRGVKLEGALEAWTSHRPATS